jgi:hypothetical protein
MATVDSVHEAVPRAGGWRGLAERGSVLALAAALAVGGLAFANGGYFPVSWGWASLGLLVVALVALVVGSTERFGLWELAWLTLLLALTGWVFLSVLWTSSTSHTVLEGERMLVYASAGLLGLLLLRKTRFELLLIGVWAAVALVCLYGLATRLFPGRFGRFDDISGYRLSNPVGYWNAFGLFAGMGLLLALGLAARSSLTELALAAASTVVLVATQYFTFSRGSWIALGIGLAGMIAVDRRRLQLITVGLVLAPWGALAVWLSSRSDALTHQHAGPAAAATDGHSMAVIVICLATGAALSALALDWAGARLHFPRTVRFAYAAVLVVLLVVCLAAASAHYGSPSTIAHKAWKSFKTPAPPAGSDLNNRLFSLSGNGRYEQWKVAWDESRGHRLLGTGAGTYEQYWFRFRPAAFTIRDVHNLYLETLAELGVVGLALLLAWLALPLLAVFRARRNAPLAAAAFGVCVAYCAHAAADWDWELAAVTLVPLLCAVGLVRAAANERSASSSATLARAARIAGAAAVVAVGSFVVISLLGNSALSASTTALQSGNVGEAESQARSAMTWVPWSAEPWRRLGEAQYRAGRLTAARRSFAKAVAKEPKDWTLWLELALSSRGAAKRAALIHAAQLNPDDGQLHKLVLETRV